ncbi:hypothetical protein B0H13DRAFT_2350434 [Mycena leptocephala]|nr:hypothetical protein B0H13DRAFT_2350434 [Mycena leptocephala]
MSAPPSSAAQPGTSTSASMLQTRAAPKRASSPSLSLSFPPPSVNTRSHRPWDITGFLCIVSTSIPPPLASPRQIHRRVSGSYAAQRAQCASLHVRPYGGEVQRLAPG